MRAQCSPVPAPPVAVAQRPPDVRAGHVTAIARDSSARRASDTATLAAAAALKRGRDLRVPETSSSRRTIALRWRSDSAPRSASSARHPRVARAGRRRPLQPPSSRQRAAGRRRRMIEIASLCAIRNSHGRISMSRCSRCSAANARSRALQRVLRVLIVAEDPPAVLIERRVVVAVDERECCRVGLRKNGSKHRKGRALLSPTRRREVKYDLTLAMPARRAECRAQTNKAVLRT